jgi:aspartate/methionine/tyrosine aminotransferase
LAGQIMNTLGCHFDENQVGMFLWGKIPDSEKSGEALADKVLYNANVFITPGFIFGSAGDRYVRISLCCKNELLAEALKRISDFRFLISDSKLMHSELKS